MKSMVYLINSGTSFNILCQHLLQQHSIQCYIFEELSMNQSDYSSSDMYIIGTVIPCSESSFTLENPFSMYKLSSRNCYHAGRYKENINTYMLVD